jgi:hypothetical protein
MERAIDAKVKSAQRSQLGGKAAYPALTNAISVFSILAR